ncbi:hypothetical protein SAMN05192588_0137 [Nonlabens sp. Hel1_33_55]|nr:hypothetical protein SAMN05192588_0137 [Nonlabens sp. Hel1_33_55]
MFWRVDVNDSVIEQSIYFQILTKTLFYTRLLGSTLSRKRNILKSYENGCVTKRFLGHNSSGFFILSRVLNGTF